MEDGVTCTAAKAFSPTPARETDALDTLLAI
jgi:hypothetical protein